MKIIILLSLVLFSLSCDKKNKAENTQYPWMKENPPILKPKNFAMDSKPYLIQGATIMTAAGNTYKKANLFMEKGLIQRVSQDNISVPQNTIVIDGKGLTLTPGLIDVHSHMGVYPSPSVDAHEDGNEMTRPITSDVWAEHGFWPQDPDLWRAMAGGITTIQVLPGSGNLIGGRSFTAKLLPQLSAREMRFPGAPQGLKMACGENPKRVYKEKSIMTRMGNVSQYRKIFQEALEYLREWDEADKKKNGKLPKRNLVLETLAKVLKGEILIHFHCYRADDISAVLDVAKEFGFKIRTIHHGLEAYKIAPRLASEDVSVATWADWWGFKAEAFDGIPYNIALLEKAGARAIVHSDSATDIRYLNLEAAKALSSAKKLGLEFSEGQALAWITKNPAWALGLEDKIGTLEKGKMADMVLWDGHPFSIYTKSKMVFINGHLIFDRDKKKRFRSDFEIGFNDHAFFDGRQLKKVETKNKISWPSLNDLQKQKIDETFVLINAKAFINGKWQPNTSVFIKDGRITGINSLALPANIKRIDVEGRPLTPGLIEPSTSLGLYEISLDSKAQDLRSGVKKPTPHFLTIDALNTRSIHIPIHRAEGVTTALSRLTGGIASSQGVAFDLGDTALINQSEVALYGSLAKKGPINRAALWSQIKILVEESARYLKNPSSFQKGQTIEPENKLPQLKAMASILKGNKPWVIEANRADDIKKVVQLKRKLAVKKYNVRFAILGGAESWLVADDLIAEDIPVFLTPTKQTPSDFDKTKARFDLAGVLQSKGVPFVIVDAGGFGSARTRQEAGMAVKYGLSPEEALKSITQTPAQFFKIKRGEIKKGAVANLVLWSNDPLEPTSWAEKVWVHGQEMNNKNRQWGLAQKYLNQPSK